MRPNDVKVHVRKLTKLIDAERKKAKKTKMRFLALSEEEIVAKLMRTNTPIIFAFSYPPSVSPGGVFSSAHWVYNPDPVPQSNLYGFAYVGLYSGAFETMDTRFPQFAQPEYPGLSLQPQAAGALVFPVKIAAQMDVGTYFLNTFLFQTATNYLAYVDNDMIIFAVK